MIDIITAIDSWTSNRYSTYNRKQWGFCETMRKTAESGEEVFPVTYNTRQKAGLDDKFQFITWMRWAAPVSYELSEEWSFGVSESRMATIPIRLVLAHKVNLGEEIVFDFVNAFPSKFTITNYKLVFVKAEFGIDPDHEAIIQAELGPANYMFYEKHRFDWNVYVININVQFLKCED